MTPPPDLRLERLPDQPATVALNSASSSATLGSAARNSSGSELSIASVHSDPDRHLEAFQRVLRDNLLLVPAEQQTDGRLVTVLREYVVHDRHVQTELTRKAALNFTAFSSTTT
jgi:hypothetical protein